MNLQHLTAQVYKWYAVFDNVIIIVTKYISQYTRFICSVNKLLELIGSNCHTTGCNRNCSVTYSFNGCCLVIKGLCSVGHVFTWTSSDMQVNRSGGKIFVNNLDLASARVVSGNNFSKMQLLFHFLHMPIISLTTFHAYQRLYICPGIDHYLSGGTGKNKL